MLCFKPSFLKFYDVIASLLRTLPYIAVSDSTCSLSLFLSWFYSWATRKEKQFTIVYRLGGSADRLERHLGSTLNHALTQANRAAGGNQVLAWRAKTKGEKSKRAWERRAKEEQADDQMGDEAQAAGQGKAKGKIFLDLLWP